MAEIKTQRWCKLCNRKTLHTRPVLGTGMGCLLTVLTAGIFIPVWMLMGVWGAVAHRWRCQACGQARVT